MTINLKKVGYVVGAVVLVVAAGVYAYYYKTGVAPMSTEQPEPFMGGLVQINTTTLTVKAADGTEKVIPYSPKTRVISQVQSGEVGRTALQLGVGDIVSFVAGKDGMPVSGIELIPVAEVVRSEGSVVVSGTIVERTASGIVVRPPEGPAMSIVNINTDVAVAMPSTTVLLTQVLGGEEGKSADALIPGIAVKVFGTKTDNKTMVADIVEILRP